MSKRLTPKEKAAKLGASADDLSQVAGKPHTVEFDHSYENSEPIMAPNPNKPSQMLYTGHDKQVITCSRCALSTCLVPGRCRGTPSTVTRPGAPSTASAGAGTGSAPRTGAPSA